MLAVFNTLFNQISLITMDDLLIAMKKIKNKCEVNKMIGNLISPIGS
jgi:hypothetical protein